MASVRISQSRPQDAIELLQEVLRINQETPPEFPTQVTLARMLLELEQWDAAQLVLDTLIKSDDSCLDVWYLFGWYYHLLGEKNPAEREGMWMEAREALLNVVKVVIAD